MGDSGSISRFNRCFKSAEVEGNHGLSLILSAIRTCENNFACVSIVFSGSNMKAVLVVAITA